MSDTERLVENEEDRVLLIRFVGHRKLPFRVKFTSGKPRTIDQNALLWMWAGEAGEQVGLSAQEQQHEWKLIFGVPILCAEDERFATLWKPLEVLPYEMRLRWMRYIPVTSIMSTKQLKQLLDEVSRKCAEQGIKLTNPEDMKWRIA